VVYAHKPPANSEHSNVACKQLRLDKVLGIADSNEF